MRHDYLCAAAILPAVLLCDAGTGPARAESTAPDTRSSSPVLVINLNDYRWKLPEFRMAGKEAYAIVVVENTHNHPLRMRVRCRTADGPIDQMTGHYTIPAREFLRMDTRRMQTRRKGKGQGEGEGVKVRCRMRADASARIKAWFYDARARVAGRPGWR